jgi:hypothetical protein
MDQMEMKYINKEDVGIVRSKLGDDKDERTAEAVAAIILGVINLNFCAGYVVLVIVDQFEDTQHFNFAELITYIFPLWQVVDCVIVFAAIANERFARKTIIKVYAWITLVSHFVLGVIVSLARFAMIFIGPVHDPPEILDRFPIAVFIMTFISFGVECAMVYFMLKFYPDYRRAEFAPVMAAPQFMSMPIPMTKPIIQEPKPIQFALQATPMQAFQKQAPYRYIQVPQHF